ncbi:MAG: DUF1993 domain-containing protein [Acetobacteraceae bacterium]|nr:DUF1993 domain-containing protein [Acetobacteraceae bacterium]
MPVTLHTFVGLYDRVLTSLAHLLEKGEAYAVEHGVSTEDMLEWRLIEDMHPLRFQAAVVINFTCSWTARAAGSDAPEGIDQATADLAGLRSGIAQSRAHLAALEPAHLEGRDDVPLTVQITDTMEPTLPAGQWLSVFATTNIYFHLSMVYAILRMKGVPIGKIDLFAGRL